MNRKNGPMETERRGGRVLDSFIDALDWDAALARIETWAHRHESRYVAICNVHSVVTASRDKAFRDVLAASDMATPDGAPVAWMLRRRGFAGQPRVNGPDLMEKLCARAADSGLKVFFYGSAEATLERLSAALQQHFPGLQIVGAHAPPFRPLSEEEDASDVRRINDSGAQIVFVGLGCPKQEAWMKAHRGRVNGVMIGVGAAFDYHAGTIRRAPHWMRDVGLEWLHRLASEPGRLWRRYLVTNTLFVLGACRELVFRR